MMRRRAPIGTLLAASCLVAAAATCSGEGDGTQFTLGGSAAGVVGGTLVLSDGSQTLTVTTSGAFAFRSGLDDGESYEVTVIEPPPGRLCTVDNGLGSIEGANVDDVEVVCESDDASLSSLVLGFPSEALSPAFDPEVTSYTATVGLFASSVSVTASPANAAATLLVQNVATGSGIASEPIPLAQGANVVNVVVTAESGTVRTYQITVTRSSTLASLPTYAKASNTEASDNFGYSVAVSGDTVVIGAYLEDSAATEVNGNPADNTAAGAGAAYVLVRRAGVWTQEAYLKASNAATTDNFGISVAIDGDTIVVGAVQEDSNATGVGGSQANDSASNSGAAYVFRRNGGAWTQEAYLKASNTAANDNFGRSVAIHGDTVAVGALAADFGGQNDAGVVYVFVRNGGVWTPQATLTAANFGTNDNFGRSVAVWDDTLIVGAPSEDGNGTGVNPPNNNNANNTGAAYVFVRNQTSWTQEAYLKPSVIATNDAFATSVSLHEDTAVIGSPSEDSNATGVNGNEASNASADSGAAYVFFRSGSTWSQQAFLKPTSTTNGDSFGLSVGVFGDLVVVGANQEDSSSIGVGGDDTNNASGGAGAAYLYSRSGTVWSTRGYLKASNTAANDQFGFAVGCSEDLIAVGAIDEDSKATGIGGDQGDNTAGTSGAVYLFR